jgi:carbon-monoxide dehydrogenase large subunit
MIGAGVRRVEDPRFLRGAGQYVEDLPFEGAEHVVFVRSSYARARIVGVRPTGAMPAEGATVITAADLGPANGPLAHPTWFLPPESVLRAASVRARPEQLQALAIDHARYVGEPIAAVLAADRYAGEDAAALVEVDAEPLDPVVDPAGALLPGSPLVNPAWPDNEAAWFRVTKGEVEVAFGRANHVVEGTFTSGRATGAPIECRGILAAPDPSTGGLRIWSATQCPHWLRDCVARFLGLAPELVHVRAPDVGGGFGVKSMVYPEELLVSVLAHRMQRPIRWIDTRREHLLTTIQARDQRHEIAVALDAEGRILGLRDRILIDGGASNVEALVTPYNTVAHLAGPYRIEALDIECRVALTNKAPLSAYRGAGRPEAVFALERLLDVAARRTGIDPLELRRRNILSASDMPYDVGILYRDGHPMVLDSGDPALCLERGRSLSEPDPPTDTAAPPASRRRGRGVAAYVEGTGIGPREQATVSIDHRGEVTVGVGPPSQGQGHETTFAQICADVLGVALEQVRVVQGDTSVIARASGTLASRTLVVVGNAVAAATERVRDEVLRLAENRLEIAAADLEIVAGRVQARGVSRVGIPLADLVAPLAARDGNGSPRLPHATESFDPGTVTFAHGVHLAQVEVDIETGAVRILRYVVVHDCGRVVNPVIVDAQIAGGVAQGIGTALFEEIRYDDAGQLVTGTLADYLLPRATDLLDLVIEHVETPSPRNPLGLKGVGEGGAIAVGPAIVNAVEDALGVTGVLRELPLTPERVRMAAGGARDASRLDASVPRAG